MTVLAILKDVFNESDENIAVDDKQSDTEDSQVNNFSTNPLENMDHVGKASASSRILHKKFVKMTINNEADSRCTASNLNNDHKQNPSSAKTKSQGIYFWIASIEKLI